jgi:cytochrome b pre-mRNA-processing protein 3
MDCRSPQYAGRKRRASMGRRLRYEGRTMGFWKRWFGNGRDEIADALYAAVVARARDPEWYLAGGVPDTIDGRFDMVATVLSLVLLRLEAEPAAALASARLTEQFVADMDGQLRQIGIGDVVVGRHMGKLMSALGGRLGAYRDGLAAGDLGPALARNLYRGEVPSAEALAFSSERLTGFAEGLRAVPLDALLAGRLA